MAVILGNSYRVVKADANIISYKVLGGAENNVEIIESTTADFKTGEIVPFDVLYAGGYISESEI